MSIVDQIAAEAQRQGVDPNLAIEVATVESNLNQGAIGSAGEIGIFQLMPATAAGLGVNPTDPNQNISGGVTLLRQMLSRYGDPAKALAGYNWGPGSATNPRLDAVLAAYGADWFSHIPASTQSYINSILGAVQTQYTPSFNPAGMATSFAPRGSVLNIPADPTAIDSASSLWGTLAVAVAVIFGISFVLSET
jgi:soluble lytic murein transglycosylase-like protein